MKKKKDIEIDLPWRYSPTIKCKSIIPGKEEINEIYLDNYNKIIKTGK